MNNKKRSIAVLGGLFVLVLGLIVGIILVRQRQIPKKEAAVEASGITCEWEFVPDQPLYNVRVEDENGNVIEGYNGLGLEVFGVPGNSYTFPPDLFDMPSLPDVLYCVVEVPNINMCMERSESFSCPEEYPPTPTPTPILQCFSPCGPGLPSCPMEPFIPDRPETSTLSCIYPGGEPCDEEGGGEGCFCYAVDCVSPTPSPTVTPTPTPVLSLTPTPTPPLQCLDTCETDADCTDGMTCENINEGEGEEDLRCVVNEDCGDPDGGVPCWCAFPTATPTMTPTATPRPTVTPTICPIPNAVTNLKISCEPGTCSWTSSLRATAYKVTVKNRDTNVPIKGFDPYIRTNATSIDFPVEYGISYICYVEAENDCGSSPAKSSEICELNAPTSTPKPTATPAPKVITEPTATSVPEKLIVKAPTSTPVPSKLIKTPAPTEPPEPTLPQAGLSSKIQIMIAIAALGLLTAGLLLPLK